MAKGKKKDDLDELMDVGIVEGEAKGSEDSKEQKGKEKGITRQLTPLEEFESLTEESAKCLKDIEKQEGKNDTNARKLANLTEKRIRITAKYASKEDMDEETAKEVDELVIQEKAQSDYIKSGNAKITVNKERVQEIKIRKELLKEAVISEVVELPLKVEKERDDKVIKLAKAIIKMDEADKYSDKMIEARNKTGQIISALGVKSTDAIYRSAMGKAQLKYGVTTNGMKRDFLHKLRKFIRTVAIPLMDSIEKK